MHRLSHSVRIPAELFAASGGADMFDWIRNLFRKKPLQGYFTKETLPPMSREAKRLWQELEADAAAMKANAEPHVPMKPPPPGSTLELEKPPKDRLLRTK
jgi:hypothetical protein